MGDEVRGMILGRIWRRSIGTLSAGGGEGTGRNAGGRRRGGYSVGEQICVEVRQENDIVRLWRCTCDFGD